MRFYCTLILILALNWSNAQIQLSEHKGEMSTLLQEELKYSSFSFKSLFDHYGDRTEFADSLGVDQLKITDLNHDGVDDLFAMGFVTSKKSETEFERVIVAIAERKRLREVLVNNSFFSAYFVSEPIFPKIIKKEGQDYLVINYRMDNRCFEELKGVFVTDTFYVKNNFLIPKDRPVNSDFSSITLKTTQCYGTCPEFELTINKDGSAWFNGINYTKTNGNVNLKAPKEDLEFINEILKVIPFSELKDQYAVCWTDDQTGYLEVNFSDGSSYKIKDYGLSGTHRLTLLYNYLYDLADL